MESFTPAQRRVLMVKVRRYNLQPGVTGLLLCKNQQFMPVLEGDELLTNKEFSPVPSACKNSC